MRLSIAAAAATTFACAQAFKDTSPFLMISSSPLPKTFATAENLQLQSRSTLLYNTKAFLSTCPSETYLVITQPSISSSELAAHAPNLRKAVGEESVKGRLSVSEVVGLERDDAEELVDVLVRECGMVRTENVGQRSGKNVVTVKYLPMIEGDRAAGVADADASLYNTINSLSSGPEYTLIYLTTPAVESQREETLYEPKFMETLHMDLKRDLYPRKRNESGIVDRRPLFEKYQFFSPGLFMGLLVSLLLLSILGVGIKAISSLQVSYGAFDKEMGPAAHKKQQ